MTDPTPTEQEGAIDPMVRLIDTIELIMDGYQDSMAARGDTRMIDTIQATLNTARLTITPASQVSVDREVIAATIVESAFYGVWSEYAGIDRALWLQVADAVLAALALPEQTDGSGQS